MSEVERFKFMLVIFKSELNQMEKMKRGYGANPPEFITEKHSKYLDTVTWLEERLVEMQT